MKSFLIGIMFGLIGYSCAMGSKSYDYDNFPIRSKEFSVFMQCKDGDKENACKYECTKYSRKNNCKKGHKKIVKLNIEKSLNNGFVLISKPYFLQLLRK